MPQDNLQNSGERGPQGKYNPLYPGELGRALFHPEMDYNLDLIGQIIHGFRVMGSNNDGTINVDDDVEKVLKLYIVTSDDNILISAGAVIGDRVWVPATISTGGGPQGYQGTQGRQGSQGRQGPRGFQGAQGFQGSQGFQGPIAIGTPGETGADGIKGDQGPQGFQGVQGTQGVQGSVGNYGGDSLRFLVGTYNGDTAANGAITFSNTTTLPSPTLSVIVSHIDADGGDAATWIASMIAAKGSLRITRPGRTTQYLDYIITGGTNNVTRSTLTLSYVGGTVNPIGTTWPTGTELIVSYAKTGPQGNQGPQGIQGVQGANEGPQGVQGTPGEPGGPQGAQGPEGLGYGGLVDNTEELSVGTSTRIFNTLNLSDSETAFQLGTRIRATALSDTDVWMEGIILDYTGTVMSFESDLSNGTGDYIGWTISVVGEKGRQGSQGPQGVQGAQGAQGRQGSQGFRGLDGANSLRWKWQANGSFPTPNGYFNGNWADGGAFNINSLTSIYLDYEDVTSNTVTPWLTLLKDKVDSGAEVILHIGDTTNPNYYGSFIVIAAQFSTPAGHLELTIDLITGTTASLINDREYAISWSASGIGGSGSQGYQGSLGDQGNQGPYPPSITVSHSELVTLIDDNELQVNALYKITGCHPSLYTGSAGTTIFLKAIEPNRLEEYGTGIFYTPKYANPTAGNGVWANYLESTITNIVGTFINGETVNGRNGTGDVATGTLIGNVVSGFIIPTGGDWESAETIFGVDSEATADITDIVLPIAYTAWTAGEYTTTNSTIWGGYLWKNLTGEVGINDGILSLDETNWQPIPYNSTDYNQTYDVIKYDYENDWISYREDKIGNKVEYDKQASLYFIDNFGFDLSSISLFQWGNNSDIYSGSFNNIIENAYLDCVNFRGNSNYANTYEQGSQNSNVYGQGSYNYANTYGKLSQNYQNTYGPSSANYYNTYGQATSNGDNTYGYGSTNHANTYGPGSSNVQNTYGPGSANYSNVYGTGSYNAANIYVQGSSNFYNNSGDGSSNSSNIYGQSSQNVYNNYGQGSSIESTTQPDSTAIKYTTLENGTTVNGADFTTATVIFEEHPKTIYKRPDNTIRIRYFNDYDVLVVAEITD